MKKVLFIFMFFLIACGGNKPMPQKDRKPISVQNDGKETYFYKVDGLQDSIISDSIWKMIFQKEGIDKLILSKTDSSAVFTIDPKLIDGKVVAKEIENRGGKVLN
jgi:hypothetical protein